MVDRTPAHMRSMIHGSYDRKIMGNISPNLLRRQLKPEPTYMLLLEFTCAVESKHADTRANDRTR